MEEFKQLFDIGSNYVLNPTFLEMATYSLFVTGSLLLGLSTVMLYKPNKYLKEDSLENKLEWGDK